MYGGKLSENDLPTRVRLCENPKPKTSMTLPPDPDSLVEELKHVYLHLQVSLKAVKAALPSCNIKCYVMKVRGNYDGVPKWFKGNQLLIFMENSSETDLKKKASLKQK